MRDRYYDQKKSSSRLSGRCAIIITKGKKKKETVLCLAGAQSLLRMEKKIQSSVWRVRDHYYDRKKKILVICLAGA